MTPHEIVAVASGAVPGAEWSVETGLGLTGCTGILKGKFPDGLIRERPVYAHHHDYDIAIRAERLACRWVSKEVG